ncbi:MAG: tRNA (adenosine(37)-N6)-dimethylallyltransferase MiaA [Desulfovibrio sp.]|nr:MAG: tRNA (adenosine(37)-N6)-dimethylallyltransferase MiaA [Desulfovibrio sp.]
MAADQPIVFLAGPTGAGKTEAALTLAREFRGSVVNFDSRQVYRDFPIITAQPSPEEQAQCPHLLYGFLGCEEKITAGAFVDMARSAIAEVAEQGRLPLLVGGTGLYMRSLLSGLAPIPPVDPAISEELDRRLAAEGLTALHIELTRCDPEYAAKIHPNDKQRTLRALEVFLATGKPLSWWHERPVQRPPYRALVLGVQVDLQELAPRLEQRIEVMLAAGALDEARAALEKCPDPHAPGWSSIGCAELREHLLGDLTMDQAKELWLRNTRAYAKRQLTWFNKEQDMRWFPPGGLKAVLDVVREFLTT